MRLVIATVLLSLCSLCIANRLGDSQVDSYTKDNACDRNKWELFKKEFRKLYSNVTEDHKRFSIFCKKLQEIILHNGISGSSFEMGVNEFSDVSSEEFETLYGPGLKFDQSIDDVTSPVSQNYMLKKLNLTDDPPEFVDWSTDPMVVTPPRNQGICGSCWAFAVVGLLEGQDRTSPNQLSIQNLIDCNPTKFGCEGGDLVHSLRDIKKMGGLMLEKDYPYVSGMSPYQKQRCQMVTSKIVPFTKNLRRIEMLKMGDEELLKRVVASYGPVAIGYHSTVKFRSYRRGVYYDKQCSKQGNHAMLLVGYGTNSKGEAYWKLKNSWGSSMWNPFNKWGDRGYGLVARNRDNNCGIASYAVIAHMNQ